MQQQLNIDESLSWLQGSAGDLERLNLFSRVVSQLTHKLSIAVQLHVANTQCSGKNAENSLQFETFSLSLYSSYSSQLYSQLYIMVIFWMYIKLYAASCQLFHIGPYMPYSLLACVYAYLHIYIADCIIKLKCKKMKWKDCMQLVIAISIVMLFFDYLAQIYLITRKRRRNSRAEERF